MSRELLSLIQPKDIDYPHLGRCRLIIKLPNDRAIVVKRKIFEDTIVDLFYDIDLNELYKKSDTTTNP